MQVLNIGEGESQNNVTVTSLSRWVFAAKACRWIYSCTGPGTMCTIYSLSHAITFSDDCMIVHVLQQWNKTERCVRWQLTALSMYAAVRVKLCHCACAANSLTSAGSSPLSDALGLPSASAAAGGRLASDEFDVSFSRTACFLASSTTLRKESLGLGCCFFVNIRQT